MNPDNLKLSTLCANYFNPISGKPTPVFYDAKHPMDYIAWDMEKRTASGWKLFGYGYAYDQIEIFEKNC